jgi:hypothetical protein
MKEKRLIIINNTVTPDSNGNDLEKLSALLNEGVVPSASGNLVSRIAHALSRVISAEEAVHRATHPGVDHSERPLSKPLS